MKPDPLPPSERPRAAGEPVGSGTHRLTARPAGSIASPLARAPRGRARAALVVLLAAFAVGLAGAWSLVARRALERTIVDDTVAELERVRARFDAARAGAQAGLQALSRVLVEDPRLKSTLATADIDAATVDDILADLARLRGAGFFMVLSPDGRVFAEAGARELRGLDLSGSSIVKRASGEARTAVGSWALGPRVMDLAITAARYGDDVIAYLVVGQAVGDDELRALAAQCGCEVADVLGGAVVASSRPDAELGGLLARAAALPGDARGALVAAAGGRHVVSTFELADVTQSHRLVLARSLAAASGPSDRLRLLLWFPPGLVLVAVLLVSITGRSPRRSA